MAPASPHPQIANALALAVIASSTGPVLLLDERLCVIAASDSFCRAFDVGRNRVEGHLIEEIGTGEWSSPQLGGLLLLAASGVSGVDGYELEVRGARAGVRVVIVTARRLEYGPDQAIRLLLTAEDVTDARAAQKQKDDLLREKAVLLQEVQHRVANSLQIIASVLLQNARQVQSDETRLHLHDAHSRVMSVAAVQQQLAATTLGKVALRPYLTQLCRSLGDSMIHDRNQLSIRVVVEEADIDADTSISLGLIVTELVINALKHAFPGGRRGEIVVVYKAHGPNWTLSICDDGVGMPEEPAAKPGLGTSIVEALSRQLDADVQVTPAHPGVEVSIVHSQIAAVDKADAQAAV